MAWDERQIPHALHYAKVQPTITVEDAFYSAFGELKVISSIVLLYVEAESYWGSA